MKSMKKKKMFKTPICSSKNKTTRINVETLSFKASY